MEFWRRAAVLVCIFVVLGGFAPTRVNASETKSALHSTHKIQYTLLMSGDVDVYERIEIRGNEGDPPLTRSFWLQPAPDAWPLLQSVDAISITDDRDRDVEYRYREYELRANLDILTWPESGTLHLRYRLHRALDLRADRTTWNWNVTGHQWRAAVERVEIRVLYPGSPPKDTQSLSMIVMQGYSDNESKVSLQEQDGEFVLEWTPGAPPSEPISFAVTLPTGTLGPLPNAWFADDLLRLFRISLAVLTVLIALALLQLFVRPERVVAMTQITNFAPVIPAMIAAFWATHYWYYESGHRDAGDDLSGEFIVNFGLAGFTLLFALKQYRLLGEIRRAAYFAQIAFPTVLLVAWPISFVDRSMLILPLLALPSYLYWFRPKVALDFGVGAHRIAEEVTVRGEVKTSELAKHFELSEARLTRIVEDNPSLLLVHDRQEGILMSAETASLRKECLICRYCGGATEALAMAQLQCGHCGREYTSKKKSQGQAPMPVVVESLAIFVESLRDGIYYMALVIALAILLMEVVAGSVVGGLIGAVIGALCVGLPGLLVDRFASRLRSGLSIGTARLMMLLATPLLFPLVIFWKLRSRRVRIFASELSPEEVLGAMADRGECSLQELSEYLKCSQEDAAELSWYLVANQLIDAVYDRRHNRLVRRELYRQIADEGDCNTCGGFYGVSAGKLRCHYCGSGTN